MTAQLGKRLQEALDEVEKYSPTPGAPLTSSKPGHPASWKTKSLEKLAAMGLIESCQHHYYQCPAYRLK